MTKSQKVDYFETLVRKLSKWSPKKLDYFAKIDYSLIDKMEFPLYLVYEHSRENTFFCYTKEGKKG